MIKKQILAWILCLSLVTMPMMAVQRNTVVRHRAVLGPPTFVAANNTPAGGFVSSVSVVLSVTAGDFVFLVCRGAGLVGLTFNSTPSNTFVDDTFSSATLGTMHLIHAFSVQGGSTTFNCNVTDSEQLAVIVMDYHPGSLSTTDTHTGPDFGSSGPGLTATTGSFNTVGPGLIIACVQTNGTTTYTAGAIGSGTGTIRQTSTGMACEDSIPNVSQNAITATITFGASHSWNMEADTFK